jgi:hypothetical protein
MNFGADVSAGVGVGDTQPIFACLEPAIIAAKIEIAAREQHDLDPADINNPSRDQQQAHNPKKKTNVLTKVKC